MLKAETIKKIAGLLKIKEADLEKAITDEAEVDVTIDPKLSVVTEDELEKVKKNGYKEGKTAGEEMAVDDVKKELGIEFTGKTVKALADAVSKKALEDAKIEPEKQVTELKGQVETLKKAVTEAEQKALDAEGKVEGVKLTNDLVKLIPAGATLAQEKVIGLMKMDGYEAVRENGVIVFKKNGETLKNKLGDPLEAKEVVETYVKENKLVAEGDGGGVGGRGGGNDGGGAGKGGKFSDLKKRFEADGKSLLGEEFQVAVKDALKEDPAFDMQS